MTRILFDPPEKSRAFSGAASRHRARQENARLFVRGILLQDLFQNRAGVLRLSFSDQRFCDRDLTREGIRQRTVQPLYHGMFRKSSGEFFHRHTVNEQLHIGNAAYPEPGCDLLVPFRIHFRQHPSAIRTIRKLFEHRPERLARTAPFCPEIDENGDGPAPFNNINLKILDLVAHACMSYCETIDHSMTNIRYQRLMHKRIVGLPMHGPSA